MIKINNRRNQMAEVELLDALEGIATAVGSPARNKVRLFYPRIIALRDYIPWHTLELWILVISAISAGFILGSLTFGS